MNQLYKVVGISKQAFYQYNRRQVEFDQKVIDLIQEAELLRREHPGCGVEKMYYALSPDFIGRDRFIELFMQLGFRVKRKKNYIRTTFASSYYYPNVISGMLISKPNQVWQSDITYVKMGERFYYAVFIIDVYTKKIVGYNLSNSLRATANVKALKMALRKHPPPDVHHSDRGSQYIYKEYIKLLKENGVIISMCQNALDNAYAERINQTIKNEYLQYWTPKTYEQLKRMVKKAVEHYNTKRPHNNLKRKTPVNFEQEVVNLSLQNRPKVTIYIDRNLK